MPPGPPPNGIDLLIVGALTIDRFADGHAAPGGSVLHAARAAAHAGLRTAVIATAGDESEARAGLTEIGRLAILHHQAVDPTVTFRHDESGPMRRLFLEAAAAQLEAPPPTLAPRAVLYAPVANELGPALGGQRFDGCYTAAILQGWLRTLEPGSEVTPLPLAALPLALVARLAELDLLIASREDLVADATDPLAQLDALRATVGPRPALVVTESVHGAWLDAGGERRHVGVADRIDGVPSVGAGDAYAAVLVAELGGGATLDAAARDAAGAVSRMLRARRA
ncbi:MAG: PfkB family carbohydrate kinase [Chloroflexota bacterium]